MLFKNYFIDEGIYAIVGGAALGGAVTKTVSVAMIVFEMTGQVNHMVPIMVGVIVANFAASSITMSIFDVILEFKNFPYIPTLGSIAAYYQKAKDIMNRNFFYLTMDAKLSDIPVILQKIGYRHLTLPIV